jgi:hypothetical protein
MGEESNHKPDHPSSIMKVIKEKTRTISTANSERHQVLHSKVICDGTIDRFEVFRKNVEDHNRKFVLIIYLIQVSKDEVPTDSQIKKNGCAS